MAKSLLRAPEEQVLFLQAIKFPSSALKTEDHQANISSTRLTWHSEVDVDLATNSAAQIPDRLLHSTVCLVEQQNLIVVARGEVRAFVEDQAAVVRCLAQRLIEISARAKGVHVLVAKLPQRNLLPRHGVALGVLNTYSRF